MSKEIGSEFDWASSDKGEDGFLPPVAGSYVFSGRTAIETVLSHLPNVKIAYLPSYCCDSMVDPFRKAGIKTEFYPVYYDNGLQIDLRIPDHVDVVLWCNYFGFCSEMPDFSDFISRDGVIIEDITHSLLSRKQFHPQSHYLVASLRKWEPILCGGYCASVNDHLRFLPYRKPNEGFLERKKTAMSLKSEYLECPDQQKKTQYLAMFRECNVWLAENYSGLTIDPISEDYLRTVDIAKQQQKRKNNATVLYDLLDQDLFLFKKEQMDCPLFVPIILKDRDRARKALIEREIYCPIHWPKPEGCSSNLYDLELSLVCDQRYDEKDMERIAEALREVL